MPTKHIYGPARPSRLALMGIRFFAPEAPPEPPAPAPAPPAPPAPAPAPPAPVPAPPAPVPVEVKTYDQEYVTGVREEAKANRLKAEQEATARATAEQERDELKTRFATLERNNAISTAAPALNANAALLLDSSSFQTDFAQVNLADPAAVTAAISAWIEKNPAYKNGPAVPGTSGGGNPHGGRTSTPPSGLAGAVAAAMTPRA